LVINQLELVFECLALKFGTMDIGYVVPPGCRCSEL